VTYPVSATALCSVGAHLCLDGGNMTVDDDRRWGLRDRDAGGFPARCCDHPRCPEHISDGGVGWVSIGEMARLYADRLTDLPYWTHGRTCADERFPMFSAEFVKCESPIELSLLCALIDATSRDLQSGRIRLVAQAPMPGSRRADILVTDTRTGAIYDIECDGRDFHNADRDGARDRDIRAAGIRVMRFSGASIKRNRRGVASEISFRIAEGG